MRYAEDYKEQTRARILAAAGRLFREKGYNGVGVDAVMAAAGLTAGGFYAHFASKEELFAEVVGSAFSERDGLLRRMLEDKDGVEWLAALIKSYLSRAHRDMVGEGCPLPTLTPDVIRSASARAQYEKYFRIFIHEIAARCQANGPTASEQAMALLAQMVGGLMLSRALSDEDLAHQVLKASRSAALMICGAQQPARKQSTRRNKRQHE
jgi:TetR/AcrR family transcriptional repressor of nem operon